MVRSRIAFYPDREIAKSRDLVPVGILVLTQAQMNNFFFLFHLSLIRICWLFWIQNILDVISENRVLKRMVVIEFILKHRNRVI